MSAPATGAAHPRTPWAGVRSALVGRPLVRDVGLLTAANAVDAACSVVQGIVVARWLGPARYGVAALAMAFPGLLFTFVDPRAADASVKYLGEFASRRDRERASAVCTLGWGVDVLIALVALALVGASAHVAAVHVVHAPELAVPIVLFTAAFVPRALAGTSTAALTTLGRFDLVAAATVAQGLLRCGLVLALVHGGAGVGGVLYGNAAAFALFGVALTALAAPRIADAWGRAGVRRAWDALAGHRRAIAGFLAWNDVNTLLGAVVKQMDLLLLGWLRGPADAGYYRLAKSLAATLGLLVGPLQNATYPRFARLAGLGRDAELRAVARRAAVRVGLPLGAAVIVALPLVPTVVAAAVGETFLPAARAAQVVLAGGAAWLAGFWVRPYLMAAGRIRTFTHLYVASLVPYAVGVALLARTWGATGMAIGFLGHNVVLFLLPAVGLLR